MQKITVLLVGLEFEENLAIRYLAAVLDANGHDAIIAPCSHEGDFSSVLLQIRKKRPAVIALSLAFQALAPLFFDLIERIRKAGFAGHIIVGGHFATFEFKQILQTQPGIDTVGRFEGEATIVHLADAIGAGTDIEAVPNLVRRHGQDIIENECIHQFPDLDALPRPVRPKHAQKRLGEGFSTVVTSRGCWHSACLYCCIGAFHKPKASRFSIRSADSVAREIADLIDRQGARIFQFHDDNFMLATRDATLRRMDDLAHALHDAGVDTDKIAFIIKARPDVVDDTVADALADLGCTGAFLGIENACPAGLAALIRAASPEHAARSLNILIAHGIAVTYNLLIFHPRATASQLDTNAQFVRENLAIPFDFGRAEVVAGSPLEQLVIDEGLRRGEWPSWDYTLCDPFMEKTWQVCRGTFRAPGVSYAAAIHSIIALAYHATIVGKLYSGPAAQTFEASTSALIAKWNAATLDSMERMKQIALHHTSEDDLRALRVKIAQDSDATKTSAYQLMNSLARYQTCRRIFRFFSVENALDQGLPAKLLRW